MQAHRAAARVNVELSTTCKGRPRRRPVWVMRYRLPSGKDSRKVLGAAWTKKGRPPGGYLTEAEALVKAQTFAASHSTDAPSTRHTFRVALDRFVRYCGEEKGLRGSTLHEYERIGERLAARPWRSGSTWADRVLDTFSEDDLLAVRRELTKAGRSADTLNHHRRVIRGIFGTHPTSPALVWEWRPPKVESEGKLRFYTPEQVERLLREAYYDQDVAIYTFATEAGARLSEIRALKVCDVDFEVDVVRIEDGYTTHGGFAGNKGRRTRAVPMSPNVRGRSGRCARARTPRRSSSTTTPGRASRSAPATSTGASSTQASELACRGCPSTTCATRSGRRRSASSRSTRSSG